MKELTGSAKIADDTIERINAFLENETRTMMAWFWLAYAALRILANIADRLDKFDDVIDYHSYCIITRPVEQ